MFPPVSSIEKGGEHGSRTYICEKLFRADADFYLLSYLTPKETYQKYFHFFVSVLVITVLAQPLLVYVGGMKKEEARQQLHEIVEQMESIEYQEKGENIFEQYLGKVDQKEE